MSGAHKRGSDGASNVDQEISTSSLDIQAMQSLNKLPQNVDPNVEKLLAALHEAIATQHSREITALEELNKGLKVKLRSFEADNKSMKVELQTCRAELEEQQPLIIRMCDEISVLTANLVEAMAISKRCEAHISEKNDILAENAALRSALLAAEQANQSETDFDLMVAKNRRLQSEITRLQAIVASTARKEDKLKMMHRSTHELNEQLMEENSTLSRQILELQQEVDDLQDEVVPLKVDHETKCVKLAPVGKGPFDTPDPDPVPIPIPAFEYSVDCDDKAGKGGQPLKESHKERLLKNGEVSSAVSENAGEGEGSDADSEDSDSTDEVTEEVEEVLGVSVTMEVSAPLVEEGAVRRRRESQQGWDDSSGREREGGLVVYDGDEVRRGYYTDAAAEGDQLPSHNVQEQEPISSIPLQPRTLNATNDRCEDGSGGSWQVLLSNVPLYITGRKVQDLAQTCGAVASVQVAEGNSSQFRIAFHSAQGAQRAVAELDGYLLNGEHLRCRKYEEFPVPPPPPPSPTTATHSNNARKKVYLRYDGGKEDVRREVEKCGEVNSISYQRSEDWFEVIFRHPLGAEEAVKRLHKYVLFRRVMRCYHSWDKDLLRTDMMSSDVAAGTVSLSVADVRRHDHDCDRDRVTSFAASPAAYPPRTHASREEDALVLNDPMLQQYKPYQDTTTTAEEDEAPNRYERVSRGDNIFPHPPHSARAPSRGRIITSDDTATAVARNITVTKSGNAGRNQRGGVQARRAREAGRQDHSVRGAGGGGGRGSGRGSGGGGRRGSEGGASGGMKRSVTKAYLEEGSSQPISKIIRR